MKLKSLFIFISLLLGTHYSYGMQLTKTASAQTHLQRFYKFAINHKGPLALAACAVGVGWWLWKKRTSAAAASDNDQANDDAAYRAYQTTWNNYMQTRAGQWFRAVILSDTATINSMLSEGFDIHTKAEYTDFRQKPVIIKGDTAIHLACRRLEYGENSTDTLRTLLSRVSPDHINDTTEDGHTALSILTSNDTLGFRDFHASKFTGLTVEGIKLLLQCKACPNAGRPMDESIFPNTALTALALECTPIGAPKIEVIDCLLAAGADHEEAIRCLELNSQDAETRQRQGHAWIASQAKEKIDAIRQRVQILYPDGVPTQSCRDIRERLGLEFTEVRCRIEAAAKKRAAQQHSAAAAGAGAH